MNTNQITKKANALRSTASSMIPSTKKIRNQANALCSTAIEKLNPFIDAITKLNGDTKMKVKKYIENMDIQPDILHLEENDKALFHFFYLNKGLIVETIHKNPDLIKIIIEGDENKITTKMVEIIRKKPLIITQITGMEHIIKSFN